MKRFISVILALLVAVASGVLSPGSTVPAVSCVPSSPLLRAYFLTPDSFGPA